MFATAMTAQIDDEATRRMAAAAAKRARRAARLANQPSMPTVVIVESDRIPAPQAVLPTVKLCAKYGNDICRLRQAYTRLELKYARRLLKIIAESYDIGDIDGAIAEGLHYVARVEHKLAAEAEEARIKAEQERTERLIAECKERFPEHVRRLAGVFFPGRPRAQSLFVRRALEIGWGPNNAIQIARNEAWAFLHPAPTKGRNRMAARV